MSSQLDVVLCWHFHQPEYREPLSGEYQQPWTYLHAIKDYVDMVGHLETHPQARAVVNFAPILIEQIEDYVQQVDRYRANLGAVSDPLLAALVTPVLTTQTDYRHALIKQCLRANRKHLIERFPPYHRLTEIAEWFESNPVELSYLNQQYVFDLLVWYHLAWVAETERKHPTVVRLTNKASAFDLKDRSELFNFIGNLLRNLLPRYKKLAENGQIELSVTPYSHPILPLILNTDVAHQASSEIALPASRPYLGGEQRARWQIANGIESFERAFGVRPVGCWPAEGAVCEDTLKLMDELGLKWAASGTNVLTNSLARNREEKAEYLYRPYQLHDQTLTCFFRDDHLSDLIGFTYSDWHSDDAVANLIQELEAIRQQVDTNDAVVSIILDGENAWEYYPQNAAYFLSNLYRQLVEHPSIRLTTFTDVLDKPKAKLDRVVAGSWVYGTLTTWIGDEQKNHAWDLLCDAKRVFDTEVTKLDHQRSLLAKRQLAICESSDWFWWFGDYNPADAVSQFDALYRMHLAQLYRCLEQTPPSSLAQSFGHGSGAPEHGGVMRHGEL